MARTGRIFRFERKELIKQFRLGPFYHVFFLACGPLLILLIGLQDRWQAWVAGVIWVVFASFQWRRHNRAEALDWVEKRKITVRFEDGVLIAASDQSEFRLSLSDVVLLEAFGNRRRIERLAVVDKEGKRDIYGGYDDMDAFVGEFRANAPQASYKRVDSFL